MQLFFNQASNELPAPLLAKGPPNPKKHPERWVNYWRYEKDKLPPLRGEDLRKAVDWLKDCNPKLN